MLAVKEKYVLFLSSDCGGEFSISVVFLLGIKHLCAVDALIMLKYTYLKKIN